MLRKMQLKIAKTKARFNKKPTNWRGSAKRRATKLFNFGSQIQCVITGDLASKRDRTMCLYAGRTRFTHFYTVLNCILQSTGNS